MILIYRSIRKNLLCCVVYYIMDAERIAVATSSGVTSH
jgi:hypothetical protein